jgi:hypothetical protein
LALIAAFTSWTFFHEEVARSNLATRFYCVQETFGAGFEASSMFMWPVLGKIHVSASLSRARRRQNHALLNPDFVTLGPP